jgi:hypothetical protein
LWILIERHIADGLVRAGADFKVEYPGDHEFAAG